MTLVDENKSWKKTCVAGHLVWTDSLIWAVAEAFPKKKWRYDARWSYSPQSRRTVTPAILKSLITSIFSLIYINRSFLGYYNNKWYKLLKDQVLIDPSIRHLQTSNQRGWGISKRQPQTASVDSLLARETNEEERENAIELWIWKILLTSQPMSVQEGDATARWRS